MEERIRKAVAGALRKAEAVGISFTVERPTESTHGDYATNAAMAAAKALKKNPRDLAEELVQEIQHMLPEAREVLVAGPGFINITLSNEAVTGMLVEADAGGTDWGKGNSEEGKRVMIEYTNPNPFKEMHIGHLMSNVIGEATSRLIENTGAKVIRDNYQGDVGPHVAKALWGLQQASITEPTTAKEIGDAYAIGSKAYEASPEAKVAIDALNTTIYAHGDETVMELWRKGRDVSLSEFEQLYRILGTHFDYYFFESETAESGARIVQDGLTRAVFEESEGAIIYRGEKRGLHTLVFITSRGTPTYEAKDIGLAFLKEERVATDRILIVTAAEQIGHFKIVIAALEELAPLVAKKMAHVPHGFLRLASGKMSSREGNVITAAGLITEITEKALEKNPDPLIAEQVAVGAIKYMILRQSPGQDIIFDPEKSLSLEGDSGPYLQYALVRAKSVLEKASGDSLSSTGRPETPYLLERAILHFPEVAARAEQELAPNILTTYLTELAGEWNSFYAQERIIGGEHEAYKLILVRAFIHTMTNGLRLLGIPTPEKM